MKAVLFDLDDTLYPEIDFVKSGFRAAARYLCSRYNFHEEDIFDKLLSILKEKGRGGIFDLLLKELGVFSQEKVELLIYIYRSHFPVISLYDDALPTLQALKRTGMRLGIVTDGMASVQRRKISALGLGSLFDVIVCTDELGKERWKPSVVPFKIALDLLETSPPEAAYVGNDAKKDFIGPNSIGMHTVQIMRNDCIETCDYNEQNKLGRANVVIKSVSEVIRSASKA